MALVAAVLSICASLVAFFLLSGHKLLSDEKIKVELGKWSKLTIFGNEKKVKNFKKIIYILLPIIFSLVDSWSDANYCLDVASSQGIYNLTSHHTTQVQYPPKWIEQPIKNFSHFYYERDEDGFQIIRKGQILMLVFLFIGNNLNKTRSVLEPEPEPRIYMYVKVCSKTF